MPEFDLTQLKRMLFSKGVWVLRGIPIKRMPATCEQAALSAPALLCRQPSPFCFPIFKPIFIPLLESNAPKDRWELAAMVLEHLRLDCFIEREDLGIVGSAPICIGSLFNEWLNHRTTFSDKL